MSLFTQGEPIALPAGGQWTLRLVQGADPNKAVILLTNPEHPALIAFRKRGELVVRELMPPGNDTVLPS